MYFQLFTYQPPSIIILWKLIFYYPEMEQFDCSLQAGMIEMNWTTTFTSQIDVYHGPGGCEMITPWSSLVTSGCCPTGVPSVVAESAAQYKFRVESWRPLWNWSVRNSRTLIIESKMGIPSPELHHLYYFLHSELYDCSVPFYHKADLILKVFSEMPEDMSAHLILSRKLVVGCPCCSSAVLCETHCGWRQMFV